MEEGGTKPIHPAKPIIILILVAIVLGFIALRLKEFIASNEGLSHFFSTFWLFLNGDASFSDVVTSTGSPAVATTVFAIRILSLILSAIFAWGIISASIKLARVHKQLLAPIQPPKDISYGVKAKEEQLVNPKWAKVLEHINSSNPSDWKLAILEADIMLDAALDKMGYHGATMSDKLKSVEPSDFDTLQEAWDAHKVRNSIAHEGSDFAINKPEAERVIKLFQKVFEEFKYI